MNEFQHRIPKQEWVLPVVVAEESIWPVLSIVKTRI
jgi:hypothetical protein